MVSGKQDPGAGRNPGGPRVRGPQPLRRLSILFPGQLEDTVQKRIALSAGSVDHLFMAYLFKSIFLDVRASGI